VLLKDNNINYSNEQATLHTKMCFFGYCVVLNDINNNHNNSRRVRVLYNSPTKIVL